MRTREELFKKMMGWVEAGEKNEALRVYDFEIEAHEIHIRDIRRKKRKDPNAFGDWYPKHVSEELEGLKADRRRIAVA